MSGVALSDLHAASLLGRETEEPVAVPRPPLRFYPAPVLTWTGTFFFGAWLAWAFATGRTALEPRFYRLIASGAASMLVLGILSNIERNKLRISISLRELGFVLTSGAKQHSVRFSDLDALTISDFTRYDDDRVVVAFNRTLTFGAGGRRVRAAYVATPSDPLGGVLDQIIRRMAMRPERSGTGWTIENDTLVAGATRIPLASISAVGTFDGELRIWQHGSDDHAFAVPLASRNAHVLHRIGANARTAAPHAVAAIPAATGGLGRLMFTRRTSAFSVVIRTLMAFGGIWVAMIAAQKFAPAYATMARPAAIAFAALAVLDGIRRAARTYRFHERAVVVGGRELRYDQIASIRWKDTTYNVHFYAGTATKGKLKPLTGRPLTIHLYRFRADDPDLSAVHRAISVHVRRRNGGTNSVAN